MAKKIIASLILLIAAFFLGSCKGGENGVTVQDDINLQIYHKGASNPVLVLKEFSDFFCPHCASVQPIVDQLLNDFEGKLALEVHHYSFMGSLKVHIANECAGEQGKFFEYREIAFGKQDELLRGGNADLLRIADGLVPDIDKFKTCLDSGKYQDKVENQRKEGREQYNITATPSFVIDNELIAIPGDKGFYEGLKEIIENKLKTPKPLA